MNISQLSAFRAVMTSSTLTDAATKLGRTQPAVSAAIKSLEDQLGMKLFERRGRSFVPVPEAHYLLTEASSILTQLTRVRQTIRGLVDGQSGNLTVAAMPGPVSMLFPKFVATYLGDKSDIKISIFARSSIQIAELARAQRIDFGFADLPESLETENLYQSDVISGNCLVALPAEHKLAKKPVITLSDLHGIPMGSLQSNHAHQREVKAAFDARDLVFNPLIESQTFLPILQFVLAGQCCAILDPLTVAHIKALDMLSGGVTVRPMQRPLRYNYAVFSPRHRPVSIIATTVREAWATEVMRLLDDVEAKPEMISHSVPDKASS